MDFKERILRSYPEEFSAVSAGKIPLPFYMTYPDHQGKAYQRKADDTSVVRDMEYLQQTYPLEVRRYQQKIAEILDKMDYEGSMIYDEYPDRASLWRLADSIVKVLKNEESSKEERMMSNEEWKKVETMVQILMCDEIYKRRHGRKRMGFVKF